MHVSPAVLRRLSQVHTARSTQNFLRRASGMPHYNEPTGWLFGEKPPPPGQKRQREDWELMWYWGIFGGMGLLTVLLYYKPDDSLQTWAMKEARSRMEARGEDFEYNPNRSS